MSFKTQCPHCNATLEVEEQWVGMECQCPQCQQTFTVPPDPAAAQPAIVAAPAAPQLQVPPQTNAAPQFQVPPKTNAAPQFQVPPKTNAAPQFQVPPKTNAAPQFHVPPKTNAAPQFHVPPKTNFASAGNANPPAQSGAELSKLIICPKCKKQHTVMNYGTYTCGCGTVLELLETGDIHVSLVVRKHTASFWILIVVLGVHGFFMLLFFLISLIGMLAAL